MENQEDVALSQAQSANDGSVSSAENQSPETNFEPGQQAAQDQGSEGANVLWENLSGSAQERFKKVTRENNRIAREKALMEERMASLERQMSMMSRPSETQVPESPEVRDAVKKLDQVGVATKEFVDNTVNSRLNGILYQFELEKLEDKYDGSNGLPSFDRNEVNGFLAQHPEYRAYTPEDVYKKMYEDEILDFKVKQMAGRGTVLANGQGTTLRPSRTEVREEPMTPETIEQRLSEPGGREWYERNQDKINAVLSRTNTPQW